ncbi:MAG: hypothetical protein ACE5F9_02115 [Phycisphaerae bacterium]
MTSHHNKRRSGRARFPDWLLSEQVSTEGNAIRREWIDLVCDPNKAGPDRRQARLAATMLLLQSERPTRPLLGRANARALRWVDEQMRRCRRAEALRTVSPELPWFQRVRPHLTRLVTPLAASILLLIARAGVFNAVDGVTRLADRLARLHIDRHIGPMA